MNRSSKLSQQKNPQDQKASLENSTDHLKKNSNPPQTLQKTGEEGTPPNLFYEAKINIDASQKRDTASCHAENSSESMGCPPRRPPKVSERKFESDDRLLRTNASCHCQGGQKRRHCNISGGECRLEYLPPRLLKQN